jgi:hypothetical protein
MVQFADACVIGNLHAAKEVFRKDRTVQQYFHGGFHLACKHGHLKIAKWLSTFQPSLKYDIAGLSWAFVYEHINICQWAQRSHFCLQHPILQDFNSRRVLQLVSFFE